ncbi:hypothetical protein K4K57_002081 [Colletotrichum sp. SAR 10_99]|nr:hypothetical protein K4K57_002081 [Colletotrichum sp. SAR 10_99]
MPSESESPTYAAHRILATAPEPPRFLLLKSQEDKALQMFAKYHANGDINDELVQWESREMKEAIKAEATSHKTSYRLFVSAVMAIGFNWVGNGIVGYYLAPVLRSVGISKPQDILSVNAGLAGWNLIVAEIAGLYVEDFGLYVEDFGRRPIFFVSMIGMIISYSFVMGFSAGFAETGTTALGVAAVPFLFLFFGSYDIAWTTLNYTYVAEIMPFSLRTNGLAIYLCVQQLGNTFNQFVNPIALQALTWRYYAVYIAVDCLYVVIIYFCFPETKKMSIEETSMIFDHGWDGRKAVIALQNASKNQTVIAKASTGSSEHVEATTVKM